MYKIRDKILLTFLSVLLIPLIIFSVLFGIYATKLLKQNKLKGFQQASTVKADEAVRLMRNTRNDIVSLSNNTFFNNYVNAAKDKGPELIKRSRLEIETAFSTFSEDKRIYDQICYIDESGREIVRVNRQGDSVYVVPSDGLQDTGHMDYFSGTNKLDEKEVYISQISLNRDDGKIEVPHKPVMKYAMPVFDNEKLRRGVLVLNVMAGNLLNSILTYTDNADIDSYLVNSEGHYLLHPEISKRWGGGR